MLVASDIDSDGGDVLESGTEGAGTARTEGNKGWCVCRAVGEGRNEDEEIDK
jgi:hypothetical protein